MNKTLNMTSIYSNKPNYALNTNLILLFLYSILTKNVNIFETQS